MPKYQYSGVTADGSPITGRQAAPDRDGLEAAMVERGIYVTFCSPIISLPEQLVVKHFTKAELTRVSRQLQMLLESGISLLEALELAHEQAKNKTIRASLSAIMASVNAGKTMAEACARFPFLFDELYVSMVESGEVSGTLSTALDHVVTYREKQEATIKKLRSALAYPMLVVVVAILVLAALILYVVPVFSSMYENFNAELPALTSFIVAISDWLRTNIWIPITVAVAVITALVFAASWTRVRQVVDMFLIRLPLIRQITVKIVSARFCRTLGTLMSAGVDILDGVRIAGRTTGNLYVTCKLEPVSMSLVEGKTLTESLESTQLFPRTVTRLTASGETTGRLGHMLIKAADFYESESATEIDTLTTLFEPIIIILLGFFVAFILIAMYLPLFELVGTI